MKRGLFLKTAAITGIAAASYLAVGNYFYDFALKVKGEKDFEDEEADPEKNPAIDSEVEAAAQEADRLFLKENPPVERHIISPDFKKLRLSAFFYPNKETSHKYAILFHGYTGSNEEMLRWVRGFSKKNFHVLTPDFRGHGQSEGNYIGMGWPDRFDILAWIDAVIEEDSKAEIVLLGLSMGAAAVMMASGETLPNNVKVIVEDSGYSTVKKVFSHQLDEIFGLPAFPIMNAANTMTKLRAGYALFQASAIKQIKKSQTPILFIHGKDDTFVPFRMLDDLYNAARVEKEKLVVPGAGHGESIMVAPQLYWRTVWDFVDRFFE